MTVNTDDCMLFAGSLNGTGYGWVSQYSPFTKSKRLNALAHRVFYETFKGEVPEGLELDHLCKVRHCINPDHLEAVTHLVNMQRRYKEPGKCKNGHSYENNEYWATSKRGVRGRGCRICSLAGDKARYQLRKIAKAQNERIR